MRDIELVATEIWNAVEDAKIGEIEPCDIIAVIDSFRHRGLALCKLEKALRTVYQHIECGEPEDALKLIDEVLG